MRSLILETATRYLLPLLLMFSVFVLLRGHNAPGGGFVGGLVATAGFAIYAISYGVYEARRTLRVDPLLLIGVGLVLAVGSGIYPVVWNNMPFMTGTWGSMVLTAVGKLGTPLVFDVGVYLVVLGVMLNIIFALAEDA